METQLAGSAESGRGARGRSSTDARVGQSVGQGADRRTTAELRTLPEGWFVMHDVVWPGHPGEQIRHVVIGPGGVFVIDTKDWSGDIALEWGDELRQNGHRRDAVVAHAIQAGVAVADSAPHLPTVHVHPVLCVSPGAVVHGRTAHLLACCADDLDALMLSQPRVLSARQVIQIVCELDATLASATGVGHAEERSIERVAGRLPLLPTSTREAATAVMALAFLLLMITQPGSVTAIADRAADWAGGAIFG